MVCVVHYFQGKLLLNDDAPTEPWPGRTHTALVGTGQVESPLDKYIVSQVRRDARSLAAVC